MNFDINGNIVSIDYAPNKQGTNVVKFGPDGKIQNAKRKRKRKRKMQFYPAVIQTR